MDAEKENEFFLAESNECKQLCYVLFQLTTAFSLTHPGVRTHHLQSMTLSELEVICGWAKSPGAGSGPGQVLSLEGHRGCLEAVLHAGWQDGLHH